MRNAIKVFTELGPLPSVDAHTDTIKKHQLALEAIDPPLSEEEARMLTQCFGPDECFGLAWSLLHLIETSDWGAEWSREIQTLYGGHSWTR